jgi:hypothetical protein
VGRMPRRGGHPWGEGDDRGRNRGGSATTTQRDARRAAVVAEAEEGQVATRVAWERTACRGDVGHGGSCFGRARSIVAVGEHGARFSFGYAGCDVEMAFISSVLTPVLDQTCFSD